MAEGSQPFMWKLYPGVSKTCWVCERPLKRDDVAEIRTLYPSHKTQFRCNDCRPQTISTHKRP